MKYLRLLLFFTLAAFVCKPAAAQTKHALIFAIGNYPEAGGWSVISSNNDVPFIDRALQKQGFLPANIKTIIDGQATTEGITKAFTDLTAKVKPGDIVTIHFSSHGEQVEDNNNDEADGLDESIVTYTAVIPAKSKDYKKDQAGYFRDDQFGTLINQLRAKLGKEGDVLVFMDACHSGSGTRGVAKVRGGQPPFVSKEFARKKTGGKETAEVFGEGVATRGDGSALATYVVISAARAEELNSETFDEKNQSMGSLTFALSKVFESLDAGTTYRSLFSKIQTIMNDITPGQHPVMEGNGIDRTLFGGKFVQQKPYVEVESVKGLQLVVKGGKFAGLDTGAKVALYPAGTNDPAKAKPLTMGTVSKAGSFNATVKLDNALSDNKAGAIWAFVTEPVYTIDPIIVNIAAPTRGRSLGYSAAEQASLRDGLKSLPMLKFEGKPDLIITKGPDADSIKIAANGYVFNTIKRSATATEQMKTQIERYTQYKFLRTLEIKDEDAYVDLKFVPVIKGKPDTTKVNSKIVGGIYEFSAGDTIVLWVKNTSYEDVYVNILDMQPDGIINPVLPNRAQRIYPGDLKIPGKASRLFTNYFLTIGPPYGTEVFKVFVSVNEIDMEGIAASGGTQTRGNFGVLEKLVKDSYTVATRGTSGNNIGKADGSTYNVLFRIKPGK